MLKIKKGINVMSLFVGLMSGTSIDAIDAVLVTFVETKETREAKKVAVQAVHSHPWPPTVRETLLTLSQQNRERSFLDEVACLDIETGKLFAQAVLAVLEKARVPAAQVTAIGSPGQTLYHHPQGAIPYTWQLGDPNVIAQLTGIPTVADFRRRDMAAGGQGAPLAPAFHHAFLRSNQEKRVVLNLGGIANITVLPPDETQPVIGFDTGPGNALLDAFAEQQLHLPLDEGGEWAASGKIHSDLLKAFLADPYFAHPVPKTTGRDYFNLEWIKRHTLGLPLPPQDIQATLCQLTVDSVSQAILPYAPQRLLICGGGVHNSFLINQLTNMLDCPVESTQAYGIDPDWVEAISFAWLAKQRLEKIPNNLPSVTGAQSSVVLGGVYI